MRISGWKITGITAVVLAGTALAGWTALEFSEEFVRMMIRATARISVVMKPARCS